MLTGSANVWATLRISESLVGRAERVALWPSHRASSAAGAVCGIEVKLGATARSHDFSALRHLQSKLGPRFKLGAVVHTGAETLPFGPSLWALPVSTLWTPPD